jgi:hypothetical protein
MQMAAVPDGIYGGGLDNIDDSMISIKNFLAERADREGWPTERVDREGRRE